MKLTLNIPESLSEITLGQYQNWLKVAEGKEDETFLQQKMIEIFCNITLKQVLMIKATDVTEITTDLSKMFEAKHKLITTFKLNENEFGFIPKLDEMSFGEYIDLDNYLSEWENMHKAMTVLFRPITYKKKDKYLIEDYEGSGKYDLKNMSLDIVFGSLVFFLEFKERIAETYPELFGESEGGSNLTRGAGFSQKWGWYQSIYGLTNGDVSRLDEITKLKLHKCLQHLAFEKDKYELEQHILNAKR
jgi:hypothetical protein